MVKRVRQLLKKLGNYCVALWSQQCDAEFQGEDVPDDVQIHSWKPSSWIQERCKYCMKIARLPATVVEQYKHMIDHCCTDKKQFRFRLGKYYQLSPMQ